MYRIDVHHHFFPQSLDKAKSNRDVGWKTPAANLPWTPEISLKSMDASGTNFAILSLPALASGQISDENRALARERNQFAHGICRTYPQRFGFFGCLPFLDDIEGCLAEMAFVLDELNADGISLSSSYGTGFLARYIGDIKYDAIWAELDRRKAVVFLHGTQNASSTPYPHPSLGIPITEVPNETFKAASHLVVSGQKRKYPNVKIILAHLGGTVPALAARVAVLSPHMGCGLTPDQILEDFRGFYYETALSSYKVTLAAIETFVEPSHVLFGTDFPAVSTEMADWFTKELEDYYREDPRKLRIIMNQNAINLFPRLRDFCH